MLGPAKTIGKAIFKDICELPPAFCLTYKNGEIKTYPYWKLEANEFDENEEEAVEHTYLLVKDSIERQLVSDVPLATFLSAGVIPQLFQKLRAINIRKAEKRLIPIRSIIRIMTNISKKACFSQIRIRIILT